MDKGVIEFFGPYGLTLVGYESSFFIKKNYARGNIKFYIQFMVIFTIAFIILIISLLNV